MVLSDAFPTFFKGQFDQWFFTVMENPEKNECKPFVRALENWINEIYENKTGR